MEKEIKSVSIGVYYASAMLGMFVVVYEIFRGSLVVAAYFTSLPHTEAAYHLTATTVGDHLLGALLGGAWGGITWAIHMFANSPRITVH